MKRRLARISVFLLLGAMVNVALAWGCVLLMVPSFSHGGGFDGQWELSDNASIPLFDRYYPDSRLSPGDVYATAHSRFGWTCYSATGDRESWQTGVGYKMVNIELTRAGWPARGLAGCFLWDGRKADGSEASSCGTINLPGWAKGSPFVEFVPIAPIWPGFAINTVFYAAVLWLLFFAPLAWRRRRRIKRGLCPKCAYDLRGRPPGPDAAVCPECGAAVHRGASA